MEQATTQTGDKSQVQESLLTRDEYFAERRHALDEQFQSTKTLDTALVTLSGGALVISITFVDRVADGSPAYPAIMLASWICFSVVVLLTLLSLYFSQKGAQSYALELDRLVEGDKSAYERSIWQYDWVKYLNFISIALFFVGVILLVVFSGINLLE
jgi:hypothetical protein